MAKRTPEEIQEQREAWLARKTAREAGQDVPYHPPLKPGEELPADSATESAEESDAAPAEQAEAPEPVEEEPEVSQPVEEEADAPEPKAEEPAADASPTSLSPEAPKRKRTPEEIRAQREAFMAAKAAKAAGKAPPKPKEEKAAPAPKPAPAAKPKRAAARKAAPAEEEGVDPTVTRREFLNYAWLASIGLFAVQTVGLSLWFAFPNFREGEFGGTFDIGTAGGVLPQVNAGPIPFTDGKFWLVNLDTEGPDGEPRKGVLAIYKVCTHLGCLYDWIPMTGRFECPCHGSKFALTGDYLAGPARRDLDRFVIQAVAPDGSIKETGPEGEPLVVNEDDTLLIDTGQRILGDPIETPA